jgi:cob(I)alamin adenosyltransferase
MSAADVAWLEETMAGLEAAVPMPEGFILPGATPASAAIDVARAVTRRAERRCVALAAQGLLDNVEVRRYLNRASLLLFVLGRVEEEHAGKVAKPARSKA